MAGKKINQALFVVVCLAAVGRCCRGDDWANDAEQKASEVANDASNTASSWADWAYSKISEGVGIETTNKARNLAEQEAVAMAEKTTDTLSSAAHGTSNMASKVADTTSEKLSDAKTKVQDTYQAAKEYSMKSETKN